MKVSSTDINDAWVCIVNVAIGESGLTIALSVSELLEELQFFAEISACAELESQWEFCSELDIPAPHLLCFRKIGLGSEEAARIVCRPASIREYPFNDSGIAVRISRKSLDSAQLS